MFNAVHFYRLGRKLFLWRIPLLPKLIELIIFLLYNSKIPTSCEIGGGSFFSYGGIGVVLHARCKIGENVDIGTNVTIGGKSGNFEVPIIGNNVYIATGAKILGPIKVGNNVTIGANAVVINDVPDNAIMAGVPARLIKYKQISSQIH
jgi:serine O-acetyltransferase